LNTALITFYKKYGYNQNIFYQDLIAGLTVGIVALPLSIAIAIASGASPDKGIITAVIGGFFISFFGGSKFQIGGPTGAFIVVVYSVISKHGYDGLLLATFLASFILFFCGLFKLGKLIEHVPHSVIMGFTSGISIILFTSQVKDFLGINLDQLPADFYHRWFIYFHNLNLIKASSIVIGVLTLAIILLQRKYFKKLPGFLIALGICTLVVYFFNLPVDTIGGKYPNMDIAFEAPSIPAWSTDKLIHVIPSAFTIAFLAGIESLLCAVMADKMTGKKHDPNQELVAQGISNFASSIFAGMPVTGALARTATNIDAGAKSPVAGIVQSFFILFFGFIAFDLIKFIPLASLAAVLFMVAYNMSEIKGFVLALNNSKSEFFVSIVTFLLTIFYSILIAVVVGLVLYFLLLKLKK